MSKHCFVCKNLAIKWKTNELLVSGCNHLITCIHNRQFGMRTIPTITITIFILENPNSFGFVYWQLLIFNQNRKWSELIDETNQLVEKFRKIRSQGATFELKWLTNREWSRVWQTSAIHQDGSSSTTNLLLLSTAIARSRCNGRVLKSQTFSIWHVQNFRFPSTVVIEGPSKRRLSTWSSTLSPIFALSFEFNRTAITMIANSDCKSACRSLKIQPDNWFRLNAFLSF